MTIGEKLLNKKPNGETVQIDGMEIQVKPLTPNELEDVQSAKGALSPARMLYHACYDKQTGERAFGAGHIEEIADKATVESGGWYDRLLDTAYEICGIDLDELSTEGPTLKACRKIDGIMDSLIEAVQHDHVDDDVARDITDLAESVKTMTTEALKQVKENRQQAQNPTESSLDL